MARRTCKTCKQKFESERFGQVCCSPACAYKYQYKQKAALQAKAAAQAKRKERAYIKARKHALETLPELKKKAQVAFNSYIRERDVWKQCISCDTVLTGEPNSFDAGHYRSVGSANHLRFNEDNCHGQCKHCNNYLSGNHVMYRMKLVKRIGLEAVEALETNNELHKFTKDELREIEATYKSKLKELKRDR